jgi:CRISPR/Cas system CSM-associated protein Csm3 (group 7 of RAMP superfamily)
MSRAIAGCVVLEGEVETRSALHVGGTHDDLTADLTVACDGTGAPVVPGTSLAGMLRAWSLAAVPSDVAAELAYLWGPEPGDTDEGHASFITVDDASVEAPRAAEQAEEDVHVEAPRDDASVEAPRAAGTEIRDAVGIDRYTGAAAAMIKFDRQVWPRGTRLRLRLVVEAPDEEHLHLAGRLAGAVRRALSDDALRLGAATSRGLGRLGPTDGGLAVRCERWNQRSGILEALRGGGEPRTEPDEVWQLPGELDLVVKWSPRAPVMVKAGADGITVDLEPLTGWAEDGQLALVLPGSSLKGALRHHAERIVRTVTGEPAKLAEGPRGFLRQIDAPPLVATLFGGPALEPANGQATKAAECRGAGALGVADCYSRTRWSLPPADGDGAGAHGQHAQRLGELRARLDGGSQAFGVAYHIAVDRWTSAPREGALYTALEPREIAWEPVEIAVDLTRLRRNAERVDENPYAALGLLSLVLADVRAGWVPVGFGTTRGLGAVEVDHVEVRAFRDEQGHGDAADPDGAENGAVGLPDALAGRARKAWQEWCQGVRPEGATS